MEELESLPKETLVKIIKMFSRNWLTLDSLWFLGVEDEYGFDAVLKIDSKVWEALSLIETKRAKETLNLTGEGPLAVMRAINFMSCIPCCPPVEERSLSKVTLSFPHCVPQEARARKGKGELPCKPMGVAFFSNVAKVIDPRVKVSCLFCPPDPHPQDVWCRWELTI